MQRRTVQRQRNVSKIDRINQSLVNIHSLKMVSFQGNNKMSSIVKFSLLKAKSTHAYAHAHTPVLPIVFSPPPWCSTAERTPLRTEL